MHIRRHGQGEAFAAFEAAATSKDIELDAALVKLVYVCYWFAHREGSQACSCVQTVVIDARGHMLGRLASILAKQMLNGQQVVCVNSSVG